jgi:SAM-dependent methyltransferase
MKESYRQHYKYLYNTHWWWRSRERILLYMIRSYALTPTPNLCSILDVGCGPGLFFRQLATLGRVSGSEPSLPDTYTTPYGTVYHHPVQDTTVFPDESYDLVLLLDVLEHVTDDRGLLEAALRVVRPGGHLLITVPAHQQLWTAHDDENMHLRRYSRRDLQDLCNQLSLDVQRMGHLFWWAGCVKWLAARREKLRKRPFHGTTVPPRFINQLLTAATILEGRLLLTLPVSWGSSLYAVVKRVP